MRALLPIIAALFTTVALSSAQEQGEGQQQNENQPQEQNLAKPFWEASLSGGDYMVHLSRLSSVSKHTYVVDGVARVTELTVVASGSVVARFYYLEGVSSGGDSEAATAAISRLQELGQKVGGRAGTGDLSNEVVKNYPHSTHAHTVEFRVPVKTNIDQLYRSIKRAWERGKGARITIK